MNYLVHLYLCDPAPLVRLGSLAGDFVKGPLAGRFTDELRRGMEIHRRVDHFAQGAADFRRSKARIDSRFGHVRGVLIDVFYDHFLARTWDRYMPQPLETFAAEVYRNLERHLTLLPEAMHPTARRMISHNWLVSYRDPVVVERALQRISTRLSRPNPLGRGAEELHRHYESLQADCDRFLASARAFLDREGVPLPPAPSLP